MTKIWEGRLKEAHKNFSKARNEAESYRAKGQNDVADLCLHRAKEKFFKVDQGARNYMRTPDFKSSGTTAGATARKTASPAVLGGTGGSGKMPPSQAMNLGELVGKTGVSVPLPASPSAAASDPKEMVEIWEGKLEKARESFSKEVNKAKDYAVRGHGPLARNLLRKAEKEFSEAIQGVRAYMKMPVFEGLERSTRLSFRRQTLTAEVLMQTTMKEVEVEIEVRKGHR
ncbi:MAG: hypothetical protein LBR62_01205 [Puniceicoccales bacterium]|jgi:hypothetical protein|nr:hypothetical protein [Puniceicoccales bacterium]